MPHKSSYERLDKPRKRLSDILYERSGAQISEREMERFRAAQATPSELELYKRSGAQISAREMARFKKRSR